jgi:hypothetical protein
MTNNIRTLRGLRDLRGENIFRHVLILDENDQKICARGANF